MDAETCAAVAAMLADDRLPRASDGFTRVILGEDLRRTNSLQLATAISRAPSASRFELERRAQRHCADAADS